MASDAISRAPWAPTFEEYTLAFAKDLYDHLGKKLEHASEGRQGSLRKTRSEVRDAHQKGVEELRQSKKDYEASGCVYGFPEACGLIAGEPPVSQPDRVQHFDYLLESNWRPGDPSPLTGQPVTQKSAENWGESFLQACLGDPFPSRRLLAYPSNKQSRFFPS